MANSARSMLHAQNRFLVRVQRAKYNAIPVHLEERFICMYNTVYSCWITKFCIGCTGLYNFVCYHSHLLHTEKHLMVRVQSD